jgi:cardiolipin synthase
LRAGGVRVIEVDPIMPRTGRRGWEVNWRDHLTILIVHGRAVFVGGINVSGAHSRGSFATRQRPANGSTLPWRDTHGRLQGPVRPSIRRIPST